MPILGINASQITGHLSNTSFESIATVTVGSGGSNSISFSSIPSTYKHLQLRITAFMSSNENIYLKLNGNDGTKGHTLQSDGTSLISEYYNNTIIYSLQSATGRFVSITDILDYSTSTKDKTIRRSEEHTSELQSH